MLKRYWKVFDVRMAQRQLKSKEDTRTELSIGRKEDEKTTTTFCEQIKISRRQ